MTGSRAGRARAPNCRYKAGTTNILSAVEVSAVEFLGIWEQVHNTNFKPFEFEWFRSEAGLNSFSLSPSKWVQATGAISIYSKAGRGGGTYAHRDIEFGSWLSPEFKLYLIKEFQRLKDDEAGAGKKLRASQPGSTGRVLRAQSACRNRSA